MKWIGEAKAILNEPSPLTPVDYVNEYYHIRAANTYSQKGKTNNLKEYGKLTSYIMRHDIRTMEGLAARIDTVNSSVSSLKQRMDSDRNRIKELKDLLMWAEHFKHTTPIINQMNTIHFKGKRESFAQEHEAEIKLYRLAKRKLSACCDVNQALPTKQWTQELESIEAKQTKVFAEYKPLQEETQVLWQIRRCVEQSSIQRNNDRKAQLKQTKENER